MLGSTVHATQNSLCDLIRRNHERKDLLGNKELSHENQFERSTDTASFGKVLDFETKSIARRAEPVIRGKHRETRGR